MKKIAVIAGGMSGGGAERVATIIANYFLNSDYEVMFIAVYGEEREYYLDEGIRLEHTPSNKSGKMSKMLDRNIQVYKKLNSFKPDVVLSFMTTETCLATLAGFRFVYTLRNDPNRNLASRLHRWIRLLDYHLASKIVFQTSGAMECFGKSIQRKGTVLPNPVVTDNLPTWNADSGSKTFIAACRLEQQKNISLLINSFAHFHQKHPDYCLEIYGDGELRNELQELISFKKAEGYIRLMGHSTDVHNIMANSFAFVLSSDYEGLSNSMLEALCIGIPCICTDSPPGGNRSYIEDKVNGFLVPVDDETAMYQAMCMCAEQRDRLPAMCANAQKTREIVAIETVCRRWYALLDE